VKLFPYQEEGAKFLAERHRGLLCDAPGLGKTVQGITAANMIGAEALDVIAPASVRTQWRANMKQLGHQAHQQSYSYEYARDKGLPYNMEVLIPDEFQMLKNHRAGRTQNILGKQMYGVDGEIAKAERVWCLSGTPSPKDPSGLYSVMLAVIPGALQTPISRKTMDYWSFKNRYCVMFDGGRGMVVKRGKNLEELKERLAPYMLRRTKRQVLKDWKEPLVADLHLDPEKTRSELAQVETDEIGQLAMDAFKNAGLEGLQEIWLETSTMRRAIGLIKVGPVIKWLLDQFDCGLEKIVLVCVHRDVISNFAKELAKHKIKSFIYWGSTDKEKDAAKRGFVAAAGLAVLLLQINAGGTGLDGLQHATGDMLLVEYSWVPDDNAQVIARLDRIGQENPVLARFVGLAGSLDDAIMEVVQRRTKEQIALFG